MRGRHLRLTDSQSAAFFFDPDSPRPLCSGSFSSLENFQEAPADMMARARLGTRLAGPAPSPREWGLSGCRPGPGPPRPWRGHWPGPATPAPGRGALLPPEPGPELTERGHWLPLTGSGSSRGPGRRVPLPCSVVKMRIVDGARTQARSGPGSLSANWCNAAPSCGREACDRRCFLLAGHSVAS